MATSLPLPQLMVSSPAPPRTQSVPFRAVMVSGLAVASRSSALFEPETLVVTTARVRAAHAAGLRVLAVMVVWLRPVLLVGSVLSAPSATSGVAAARVSAVRRTRLLFTGWPRLRWLRRCGRGGCRRRA